MADVEMIGVMRVGDGGDARVVLDDEVAAEVVGVVGEAGHVEVVYVSSGARRIGVVTVPLLGVEGNELRVGSLGDDAGDRAPVLDVRLGGIEPHQHVAALVATFADRMERRDWEGFRKVLHPEVVYELPQTRERIRGRDTYVTFNTEYPGKWHIAPQIVLGDHQDGALLFEWTVDGGEPSLAVAFFEAEDNLITKVTDFWPEPYEPPPGREHLVERW